MGYYLMSKGCKRCRDPPCPIVIWYVKVVRTNHQHSVISDDWKREGYPGQWATGASYKYLLPYHHHSPNNILKIMWNFIMNCMYQTVALFSKMQILNLLSCTATIPQIKCSANKSIHTYPSSNRKLSSIWVLHLDKTKVLYLTNWKVWIH